MRGIGPWRGAITRFGNRVFTVGQGGDFTTFFSALAHVEKLPHFTELYTGIAGYNSSDLTWTQGSRFAAMSLGALQLNLMSYNQETLWIKFAGDTEEYARLEHVTNSGIYLATRRQSADIAIIGEFDFSVLRPIYYKIILLDDVYNEGNYYITKPINLIVEGIHKAIRLGTKSGSNKHMTFKLDVAAVDAGYGQIFLRRFHAHSNEAPYTANVNVADGGQQNHVDLIVDDVDMTIQSSDWLSANIQLGSFNIRKSNVMIHHLTGAAHVFMPSVNGDINCINNDFTIRQRSTTAHTSIFTGTSADTFRAFNNNIYIQDRMRAGNGFVFVSGVKGNKHTIIDKTTIYADAIYGNCTYDVQLTTGNPESSIVDNVANSVLEINDCHFVGGFDAAASLYDIDALPAPITAQNATIKITNSDSKTAITPDAVYDTVVSDSLEYIQAVTYAAVITPDANLGQRINVGILTGAITVNAPANPQQGQKLTLIFTQDAVGGHAITFNAIFKVHTNPVGAADQKSIYKFEVDGANWVQTNAPGWA